MRVRIIQALSGVVDGVPLSSLVPGFVYDLDDAVAMQLIEMRGAAPARSTDIPAISAEDVGSACLSGGVHVVQPDTAHAKRSRPSKRRR